MPLLLIEIILVSLSELIDAFLEHMANMAAFFI